MVDGINIDFDAVFANLDASDCKAAKCDKSFNSSKVDLGLATVLSLSSLDTMFQIYKSGNLLFETHDTSLLASYYGDSSCTMLSFAIGPKEQNTWASTFITPRNVNWKCFSKKVAKVDLEVKMLGEYLHIEYYDTKGNLFMEKDPAHALDIYALKDYLGVLHGFFEYEQINYAP